MITKVKMPRLGENVNSVFIVELKCEPGQQINAGEILVSVETDKATVDVVKIDEEVQPGMPYVIIETA